MLGEFVEIKCRYNKTNNIEYSGICDQLHLFIDVWNTDEGNVYDVDFQLVLGYLSKLMSSLQYDAHKKGKQAFRRWLDEALDKGAKGAHRWTNAPNTIEAIDPSICGERMFGPPIVAVEHRADKWRQLWCRDEHNADNINNAVAELIAECCDGVGVEQAGYGILTPDIYDPAILKLSSQTGKGGDLWGSSICKGLPDGPKEDILNIYNTMEYCATTLIQIMNIIVTLNGKPNGGG